MTLDPPGPALRATTLTYRLVGSGSHHWDLADAIGARWFVKVDDLRTGASLSATLVEQTPVVGA